MAHHLYSHGFTPVATRGKIPFEEGWKTKIWTEAEIQRCFNNDINLGLACGAVSDNTEVLDFDCSGECYSAFVSRVEKKAPGLISKLVISQTPSDGYHIWYRCKDVEIPGNKKLAKRRVVVGGPGSHSHKGGKPLEAREDVDEWVITPALIETRGNGGQAIIPPSQGYQLIQPDTNGTFTPPIISAEERQTLIDTAKEFHEPLLRETHNPPSFNTGKLNPGDDFSNQATGETVLNILTSNSWYIHSRNGDKTYVTRPGKDIKAGSSGTVFNSGVFYNFSSSADPFEQDKSYSPFSVYGLLSHGGDFHEAAKTLGKEGYGEQRTANKDAPNLKLKKKPRGRTLQELKKQFEYGKEIKFVWRDHIPQKLPIMIAGREGTGKTTIALQIAKEILENYSVGYVVWLATEGAVMDTIDKMTKMGFDDMDPRLVIAQKRDGSFKFDFSRQNDLNEIDTILSELDQQPLAVFIDSIRGMSKFGDNDDQLGRVMHQINATICDKNKAGLIYLDHHKKGSAATLLDKTSGTTAKTSAVRAVLAVEKKSAMVRSIKPAKVNIFVEMPELESIKLGNKIIISQTQELSDDSLTDKAEAFLTGLFQENSELFARDVYRQGEKKGFKDGTLKKAKKNLPIEVDRVDPTGPWIWKWAL